MACNGNCPKCGGMMGGPTYVRDRALGHEYLHYRCTTCGYGEERPTKDAHRERTFEEAAEAATKRAQP